MKHIVLIIWDEVRSVSVWKCSGACWVLEASTNKQETWWKRWQCSCKVKVKLGISSLCTGCGMLNSDCFVGSKVKAVSHHCVWPDSLSDFWMKWCRCREVKFGSDVQFVVRKQSTECSEMFWCLICKIFSHFIRKFCHGIADMLS